MSRIDAVTSRIASIAVVSFTTRVAERILLVSSRRLRTVSIAASTGRPDFPPAAGGWRASLSWSMLDALSGVTRNVSGSGLLPSSW